MAARSNAVITEPTERELAIERVFDAPRELVFKCWTEPEHLARWIGPKGFSGTIVACELREGGIFRAHMRGPDGQDHWQHGVFREIVPPERIVRTYCWTDTDGRPTRPETLLTVTFADLGGRTRLTRIRLSLSRSPRAMIIGAAGAVRSINWLNMLRQFKGIRSLSQRRIIDGTSHRNS
jgi:uncharacterized protein YndB with AHSA1/START domain